MLSACDTKTIVLVTVCAYLMSDLVITSCAVEFSSVQYSYSWHIVIAVMKVSCLHSTILSATEALL